MMDKTGRRALRVLATAVCFVLGGLGAAEADPFTAFAGRWSGSGQIGMTDGSAEKIACKVKYSVGGGSGTLHANVRCASDSFRVHILFDVVAQGLGFSGTWEETTRQVSGQVTGDLPAAGQLQASLAGLGFGIQLAASVSGKQQAIVIQSQNTDVKSVSIALRRS